MFIPAVSRIEVDALANRTSRIRTAELGERLDILKRFGVHAEKRQVSQRDKWEDKHARSIRRLPVLVLQQVLDLRNEQTTGVLKVCRARWIEKNQGWRITNQGQASASPHLLPLLYSRGFGVP